MRPVVGFFGGAGTQWLPYSAHGEAGRTVTELAPARCGIRSSLATPDGRNGGAGYHFARLRWTCSHRVRSELKILMFSLSSERN